nr:HAD family phosphatase [Bifidobacterium margollesii]
MTDPTITDVIFDFCGVLFDWQCRDAIEGRFPQDVVDRICSDDDECGFYRYEDRLDAGEDLDDVLADYREEFGDELAGIFRYYQEHYEDALPRLIPGMEQLLHDLHDAGLGVWGLTNWGWQTFPTAFAKFPRIKALLDGTIVSGIEKMHKPNADIYELAMSRFHLTPERSVFFDDTAKNITGAQRVGLHAFQFTDADQARKDLASLGVTLQHRDAAAR